MVAAGRFREDLYYRLQGMVVRVPPLRERKQEIPALVEHFRREIVAAGQSRVQAFSTDVMDELFRRDWPGNVRELRNAVFRTMVLAPGTQVELADLRAALPIATGAAPAEVAATPGGPPPAAAAQPAPPSAGHGGAPGRAPDQPRNGTAEALAELAGSTAAAPIEPTVVVPQPALSNGGEPDFQTVPVDQLPDRLRRLLDLIVRRGSIGTSEHMDSHGISHRTGLRDLQILVKMGLVERVGQRRGARYRPINRPSPK